MKKTFVFYNDREDYTEEMTMEEKGMLLQAILNYQNWKDVGDIWSIKFVFSRIKKQLNKDNEKRDEIKTKRSEAWNRWNEKRRGKKPSQTIANATEWSQLIAVNVTVNDTVNDTDTDSKEILPTEEAKPLAKKTDEYWNKEINECLNIIKEMNWWICDWTAKQQRYSGKHLIWKIKKLGKVSSWEYTWQKYLRSLLVVVAKNSHHSHKIAWPQIIFDKLAELQNVANQTVEQENAGGVWHLPWI